MEVFVLPHPSCRAMARKLQSMSHEFRGMQKAYLDQLRKFKGGGAGSFSALIGEPTPKATGEDETKETDKVRAACSKRVGSSGTFVCLRALPTHRSNTPPHPPCFTLGPIR